MLNVLSLFSGIGAFEKALNVLNVKHNVVAYCEIDKHASRAYQAIHNISEVYNLKDVRSITSNSVQERIDLITYGFPCQDISNAGKQKGFIDANGERTRSGLFFEALRIIEDYHPKFAIAENVKALTGSKFTEEFKTVLKALENAGYYNYWKVLNAKDYGIPQNRERVFIISIRKDIDKGFIFPQATPLKLQLKDLLEDAVAEKYYLSDEVVNNFYNATQRQRIKKNGFKFNPTEGDCIAHTITTKPNWRMTDNFIKVKLGNAAVGNGTKLIEAVDENIRVRRLTPIECYKLMGFSTTDCKKAQAAKVSDRQLYKQAGNSIVVNVLMAIFTSLSKYYDEFKI